MSSKTALITGASSDIGRFVATGLATNGFNIAAHYHSNLTAVQAVEKEAKEYRVEV